MSQILCPVYASSLKFPESPAIIEKNRTITYWQLQLRVAAIAQMLKSSGIKKGNQLAVIPSADAENIAFLWALWRIKAVACLLNPQLPKQILSQQISTLGARRLKIKKGDSSFFYVTRDIKGSWPLFSLRQPATVMFTSGSTGSPKPALHSFGNHYYSALGSNEHIRLQPGDRWLLSLPLYHVSGLSILFRTAIAGAAIVMVDKNISIERNITKYQISHTSLVTTQLYELLKVKKRPDSFLKAVLVGGSAISKILIEESIKARLPLYISYGLTEMSSQVATSRKLTSLMQPPKVKILRHRKIKISHHGEILVKGPTLFKGYLDKNSIRRPPLKNGWFPTGDLGECKAGGLTVSGRKDNLFISGGENIQPEEIEKYLYTLKEIKQTLVVPRVDKEYGQRPIAFIEFHKRMKINPGELRKYLMKFLPKFKIPDKFYPWPKMEEGIKINRKWFEQKLPVVSNL